MTQYNTLWYNSQLNKLKLVIKNGTEVALNLSANMIGYSNDETSFAHKLLKLIHKFQSFAIGSSPIIKLSKTQLSKMV